LWFRVCGLGFGVWGLGFGVEGLGLGVYGRCRVASAESHEGIDVVVDCEERRVPVEG